MAVSRLDEIYIQCNKLMIGAIGYTEFRLWGLQYFVRKTQYDQTYWVVRAAVLAEIGYAVTYEIASLVVLEVNEKDNQPYVRRSDGDEPGEG